MLLPPLSPKQPQREQGYSAAPDGSEPSPSRSALGQGEVLSRDTEPGGDQPCTPDSAEGVALLVSSLCLSAALERSQAFQLRNGLLCC